MSVSLFLYSFFLSSLFSFPPLLPLNSSLFFNICQKFSSHRGGKSNVQNISLIAWLWFQQYTSKIFENYPWLQTLNVHFRSSSNIHLQTFINEIQNFHFHSSCKLSSSNIHYLLINNVSDPYNFDADPDPQICFRDDGSGSRSGSGSGSGSGSDLKLNKFQFFLKFFCIRFKTHDDVFLL